MLVQFSSLVRFLFVFGISCFLLKLRSSPFALSVFLFLLRVWILDVLFLYIDILFCKGPLWDLRCLIVICCVLGAGTLIVSISKFPSDWFLLFSSLVWLMFGFSPLGHFGLVCCFPLFALAFLCPKYVSIVEVLSPHERCRFFVYLYNLAC